MDNALVLLKGYFGAFKIECRAFKSREYSIYGFRNSEEEWNPDKGELVLVTHDIEVIKMIEKNFYTFWNDTMICRNCFRKKRIKQLSNPNIKYLVFNLWDGFQETELIKIQNKLIRYGNEFAWSYVKGITEGQSPFIYFPFCFTYCLDEVNSGNTTLYEEYSTLINNVQGQVAAEWIENSDEVVLEQYLADHLELIEEGMTLIETQKRVSRGKIDILARDSIGKLCIIELKVTDDDKRIVWQASYYPSEFNEDCRLITITPDYSEAIYKALKNVKNTELKYYFVNTHGMLEIANFEDDDDHFEFFLEDTEYDEDQIS
jgi:Endonuclease NucS